VIPRSYLYVPGARPDRFAKAMASGADAVIFDLEDSVPVTAKAQARAAVVDFLRAVPSVEPPGPELWVRVNSGEAGIADVRAVAPECAVFGLCVAKAEGAGQLAELDRLLTTLGSTASVEPLLETAAAILAAREIAAAPRVRRLQIGEADLAADLSVVPSRDGTELLWARSAVVTASAAAGLDSPVGGVSTEFSDLGAYAESTRALRGLGFWGRACIHPAQLPVTHQVFTSSESELAWAHAVVATLADARRGVATGPDGRLVDEAVARIARRILARQSGQLAQLAQPRQRPHPGQLARSSEPMPSAGPIQQAKRES
jgi:citrate lyase subunit beta / citryl-CoA lyase